jgi:Domain of unknown function (DUF4303)
MPAIDYTALSNMVRDALRASFADLLASNPDRTFYAFAVFTDDSLQFAHPVANTEEGLTATVRRYNEEVDPMLGITSTHDGMRWSYGDWEFFPDVGKEHFQRVNEILGENFCADEDEFAVQIEPLWQAMLDGFLDLKNEDFFGTEESRSRITLLVVGHVPVEIADHWITVLNPPDVAKRCLEAW